ncbi:hypothetical protein [Streptomyces shenzhenensis]|uniref:hypothetical protein n=1 Tax=Streptomyces shenzhenensis TaxID=943815 RepID=UPI001F41B301|nr:hypothetical protein [Streptomyces shenzhenensis]
MPREAREIVCLSRSLPPDDEDAPGLPLDGLILNGTSRSLVLIGPPCSGRTSVCVHYASELAKRLLAGEADGPVPLLFDALDVPAQDNFVSIAEAIVQAAVARAEIGGYGETARSALQNSLDNAFLFVDGVEDVPTNGHRSSGNWSCKTILSTVAQLQVHYPNLRILMTISDSTWFSNDCARSRQVQVYTLRPPRHQDVETYINTWFGG